MSDVILTISVPSDDDGFVTLQCSFCDGRFKLTVNDFESDEVVQIFCPYCGLPNEGHELLTDEVMEQANILAENYAKSLLNDFTSDLRKSFRGNKNVSFKPGRKLAMDDEAVLFEQEELELMSPTCCKQPVKVSSLNASTGIYCPFCGVK